VTLLEAGPSVGGLVAGWKTKGGKSIEAGAYMFICICIYYIYKEINRPVSGWMGIGEGRWCGGLWGASRGGRRKGTCM
jgi:hypothetical protein